MCVRVGIIGAGWIATQHVATLQRLGGAEVVAVCDVDEARAKELAGGAATYTDWRRLIDRERPDALFVCTPPLAHREVTVAALEQGINVYLEKPIARGLEDARAIVVAAAGSRSGCRSESATARRRAGPGSSTARRAAGICSSGRAIRSTWSAPSAAMSSPSRPREARCYWLRARAYAVTSKTPWRSSCISRMERWAQSRSR